jgi:methionine synthase II (cobalamin-independent)
MARFTPCLLTTGIGSLPHKNRKSAIELIMKTCPQIPFSPQFPKKSYDENMYVQVGYDLPGAIIDSEKGKFYIDTSADHDKSIEQLFQDYLDNKIDSFRMDEKHASGIYALLNAKERFKPVAVKGEITGPVSMGMAVADETGKPLIYSDKYMEILTKSIAMKAKWMEKTLKDVSPVTILSLDEPSLGQTGSGYFNISWEKAAQWMGEVLSAMNGLKGVHCCSNTDWGFLLKLKIDIVFFDAYNDFKTLLLYPKEIKTFIENGGIISWGIVPNTADTISGETAMSLAERLERYFQVLAKKGIPTDTLIRQSLLTTTCGLGGCDTPNEADRISEIMYSLSRTLRLRHKLSNTD